MTISTRAGSPGMSRSLVAAALCCCVLGAAPASAAVGGGPAATQPAKAVSPVGIRPNPLADLPGRPGPTVDRIKALHPGQWLDLGAPAADPKWGRARGCSWGGQSMVLAPELRGAFRAGEGVHAYVKPDGFGQDDFWFYDINAHRWICLYPGTDTRNFNKWVRDGVLKVDDVGRVVDMTGQPIPGHLLIHAFGYLAYDTDRRKFTVLKLNSGGNGFGRYYMPGVKALVEGLAKLEEQGLNRRGPNFAPWAYSTRTGRFERDLAENAMPDLGGYFPQALYVPSRKQFFVAGTRGIAFFDPATRSWSEPVKADVAKGWSLACHDSRRDRVYGGHVDLHCYDLKTGALTQVKRSADYSLGYNCNRSALVYDSGNDMVLCLSFHRQGQGARDSAMVAPLDPQTNTWREAISFDPKFKARLANTNAAFYDPELAVVFIYSAGDSRDDGVMWVYKPEARGSDGTGVGRPLLRNRAAFRAPCLRGAGSLDPALGLTEEGDGVKRARIDEDHVDVVASPAKPLTQTE